MFRTFAKTAALLLCVVTLSAGIQAQGPNLLTNPGFELGTFTGYGIFTNAYVEMTSLPQFEPHTGNYMCSIFGGFWGVFNTSGIFQSFNALEGEVYEMDCYSRHWSGDALIGAGAPASNSVLMRIAFFDAAGQEIPNSGADRVILDGTFATDVWHDNMPVRAVAPAGTVAVQPLIIYLQPGLDPGAVHVDDLEFRRAFGLDLSQDTNTLDLTIDMTYGEGNAQYGLFYSFDPLNGSMPGMGNIGGLFLSAADFNAQLTQVFAQVPPYGGFLDPSGGMSATIPGTILSALSGMTVYALGADLLATGAVDYTNIPSLTFQ